MSIQSNHFSAEFWEASQALMPLLYADKVSTVDQERMNASLVADLFGDRPIAPPPSRLSPAANDFFYAILNLYGSVDRFRVHEKMFRRYPWRGSISKGDHLQSAYYLFVHETYIFEERLKRLFSTARAYATTKRLAIDLKTSAHVTMRLHKSVFAAALRWRGTHVHQDDFVPRDIRRIGLLDTQAMAYGLRDKEALRIWSTYRDQALREVRSNWVQHCVAAQKASQEIATYAFRHTKPIWMARSRES